MNNVTFNPPLSLTTTTSIRLHKNRPPSTHHQLSRAIVPMILTTTTHWTAKNPASMCSITKTVAVIIPYRSQSPETTAIHPHMVKPTCRLPAFCFWCHWTPSLLLSRSLLSLSSNVHLRAHNNILQIAFINTC